MGVRFDLSPATLYSIQSHELNSFDPARWNTQTCTVTNQAAYEGLEDAGIPLHEIFKTRTGVFAAAYCPFLPSIDAPDETLLRSSAMSSIADHVSYFLGTHGPSVTLETACRCVRVGMTMGGWMNGRMVRLIDGPIPPLPFLAFTLHRSAITPSAPPHP